MARAEGGHMRVNDDAPGAIQAGGDARMKVADQIRRRGPRG